MMTIQMHIQKMPAERDLPGARGRDSLLVSQVGDGQMEHQIFGAKKQVAGRPVHDHGAVEDA